MGHHITTVRLEDPLWKKLQQTAKAEDRSVTTVVTRAIQKALKLPYKNTEGHRPGKRDKRSTRHEVSAKTKKTARS